MVGQLKTYYAVLGDDDLLRVTKSYLQVYNVVVVVWVVLLGTRFTILKFMLTDNLLKQILSACVTLYFYLFDMFDSYTTMTTG